MGDLLESGVRCVWSQHVHKMPALYTLWYMKNNGGFSHIFDDQASGPQRYALRGGLGKLLQDWSQLITADVKLNSPVASIDLEHDEDSERVATVTIIGGTPIKPVKSS